MKKLLFFSIIFFAFYFTNCKKDELDYLSEFEGKYKGTLYIENYKLSPNGLETITDTIQDSKLIIIKVTKDSLITEPGKFHRDFVWYNTTADSWFYTFDSKVNNHLELNKKTKNIIWYTNIFNGGSLPNGKEEGTYIKQ